MSGQLDPDELLDRLRDGAGAPLLAPLRVDVPSASARRGPAGRIVDAARRSVLKLLSPVLADLITQLERDRHRQLAEIGRLTERVERLERDSGAGR